MYDPEFSLWLENLVLKACDITNEVRNKLGDNNRLVKFCECFDSYIELIKEMHNDYQNCFDEAKREIIAKDIKKAVDDLDEFWKKVVEIYDAKVKT